MKKVPLVSLRIEYEAQERVINVITWIRNELLAWNLKVLTKEFLRISKSIMQDFSGLVETRFFVLSKLKMKYLQKYTFPDSKMELNKLRKSAYQRSSKTSKKGSQNWSRRVFIKVLKEIKEAFNELCSETFHKDVHLEKWID